MFFKKSRNNRSSLTFVKELPHCMKRRTIPCRTINRTNHRIILAKSARRTCPTRTRAKKIRAISNAKALARATVAAAAKELSCGCQSNRMITARRSCFRTRSPSQFFKRKEIAMPELLSMLRTVSEYPGLASSRWQPVRFDYDPVRTRRSHRASQAQSQLV